ncbi:hypothetical protein ACVWYG_003228 [Pedobacter sp. UYEF25]
MKNTNFLKIIWCLCLFNITESVAQAQKTADLADQTRVTYTVNDAKKLNGPYTITKGGGDKVYLRGSYKDGERVGNWYAFNDDGNVFLRYNYDQKKLVYLDTTSINRLMVEVLTKNEDKTKAVIPVPIASIDEYVSLLGTEVKRQLLAENKNAEGTLDVELVSIIDAEGNPKYEARYTTQGIAVTKRLVISEKYFDLDWIPANFADKNLPSIFIVKARINFDETDPGKQRFIWAY